ncbi:MAG: SBBP repeat-containing protein [Bacteroidota bacterium]
MSKKLLSAFSLLFSLSLTAQVNIQWASRYTSTGAFTDKINDIALDASGNVYVCGTTWSGTTYDYLVIKYDNAGNQLWARTYNGGGNSIDQARAIVVDGNGDVYVTGASYYTAGNDDYVTIKYSTNGTVDWTINYNGSGNVTDEAFDIALDANGNVFVTGGSGGSTTGEDYATVKYDTATGTQQAVARYSFTGASLDRAQSIAIDAAGNVYVTGFSYGGTATNSDYATLKYDNALVAQWGSASRYNGPGSRIDQASVVRVSSAGNVYVTGYSNNTYILDDDLTTVMYNASGAQQWVSRYGANNAEYDRAYGLAVDDATGDCYVTGMVYGTGTNQNFVTIRYDINGTQLWASVYNGTSNGWDEGRAVWFVPGYVYVSGFSNNTGANMDVTTIKYETTNGLQQWLTKYNYTANNVDQGFSMQLDAAENIYIGGQSHGGSSSVLDALTIKYCQMTASAGNDTSICLNASVQLNASATGAVAYNWSPATGLSSTTISNPIANPTATTTYVVVITNTSGCTDSDTMTVTVYPLPAPAINTSGPTTFCAGDSVLLCAPQYDFYSWSPGGATTQCITASSSGNYSVIVTDSNTCAAQSQVTVTVNPLPNINAGTDTVVCLSDNAQLCATGGLTYSWSPAATLSDSTIACPQAGMVTTTTYTVIGTDANGCSNTDSVTVQVNPNPPVPTITYNGYPLLTITCNLSGYNYQWYALPNNPIPGATSQSYTPTVNGTYWVIISDSIGCSTASAQVSVNDVGMEEADELFGSQVYPNPSSGWLTLSFYVSSSQDVQIRLLTVTGETVYHETLHDAIGTVQREFDLQQQAKGIYVLQLISPNGAAVKKIIIN